jgi:hypothetical protein
MAEVKAVQDGAARAVDGVEVPLAFVGPLFAGGLGRRAGLGLLWGLHVHHRYTTINQPRQKKQSKSARDYKV